MSDKFYGIVGTNQLAIGKEPKDEQAWVEAAGPRPSVNHFLQADGTWLLNSNVKIDRDIEAIATEAGVPVWFLDHIILDHGSKSDMPAIQEAVNKKIDKDKEKS